MNKKDTIKTSAYQLFLQDDFELASVNSIVKDAGVAKGTYYLYYQTKEEVYLDILEDFYEDWFQHINETLKRELGLQSFLEAVVSLFTRDKKFLELLSRANLILEKNISKEFLIRFKTSHNARLSSLAENISKRYGPEQEVVIHKLLLTYACIIGVYQTSKTPSCVTSKELQELKCMPLDFEKGINDIVPKIWGM